MHGLWKMWSHGVATIPCGATDSIFSKIGILQMQHSSNLSNRQVYGSHIMNIEYKLCAFEFFKILTESAH